MVPLSMTLSDHWPGFQGHDIFEVEYRKKTARLKDKITIAQEETVPNMWNGTMFGDLDLTWLKPLSFQMWSIGHQRIPLRAILCCCF